MTFLGDLGSLLGVGAFLGVCWLYALLADRMVSHR
jgi:hypothetical protein